MQLIRNESVALYFVIYGISPKKQAVGYHHCFCLCFFALLLFKGKYYSLGPLTQRVVYAIFFDVLLTSVLPSPGDISNL